MKIAVLSDIHANLAALMQVKAHVDKQNVDGVWVLGDIIGRGCDPSEVAAEMKYLYDEQPPVHQRCWLSGNHERFVLSQMDEFDLPRVGFTDTSRSLSISGDSRQAIAVALEHSELLVHDDDLLAWLHSLPAYRQAMPGHGIYLVHGAMRYDTRTGDLIEPETYGTYLLYESDIKAQFEDVRVHADPAPRLILGGHTHISGIWQWKDGQVQQHKTDTVQHFDLTTDTLYINPGSVGFPRFPDTCPTYMTLTFSDDMTRLDVLCHHVAYTPDTTNCWRSYPGDYLDAMRNC